jgi:hypothetical protein
MPLSYSKFKMQLSSNFSKSSVNVAATPEGLGSPVYYDASSRAQGTSSELNLDQQPKLQRLKSNPSRMFNICATTCIILLFLELHRGAKSLSNASVDSFHTAGVGSTTSQQAHIDDVAQATPEREDTAKAFAERAWQEDPDFVEREKLVEWLGSP